MTDTVHDGISGCFAFNRNTGALKYNAVAGITNYSNTNEGMAQVLEFITSSSFKREEVCEWYDVR